MQGFNDPERTRKSPTIEIFRCCYFFFQDVFQNGIKNLFEEHKFYEQYPERELRLTATLFGGFFERGLFPTRLLLEAFKFILDGLKKPPGSNLWNFAVTALDRCKAR